MTSTPTTAARGAAKASWFAPGRANLMGEHTDYNGGLVLPFALAQGVTATATARADGVLTLRSKQMPGDLVTVALAALRPGSVAGWAAYPAGVAWSLAQAGYPVPGAEVDIDSDLPVGAGISSSAALECAVALALCDLAGLEVGRWELAAIARRAENDFVGAPTGMIDQSAALLCREGHAMLLDCGAVRARQVPFRPGAAGLVALVIDTKIAHALVSGEYAARRAECERAARLLGVAALGVLIDQPGRQPAATCPGVPPGASPGVPSGASPDALLAGLSDPVLRRRARHVLTDSARARAIADALDSLRPSAAHPGAAAQPGAAAGAQPTLAAVAAAGVPGDAAGAQEVYRHIGELLTEGHVSLRDDFEVSWPQADATVEVAVERGAFGAKMIGGGFGGSVLALVPAGKVAAVRAAVTATFERRSWVGPEYLTAVPSPAARKAG